VALEDSRPSTRPSVKSRIAVPKRAPSLPQDKKEGKKSSRRLKKKETKEPGDSWKLHLHLGGFFLNKTQKKEALERGAENGSEDVVAGKKGKDGQVLLSKVVTKRRKEGEKPGKRPNLPRTSKWGGGDMGYRFPRSSLKKKKNYESHRNGERNSSP